MSSFTFPDPLVTAEFTADNGITYSWDATDSKWVVKSFTEGGDTISPFTANQDYVRQDGTSTMAGDLKFSGNRSVKSTDGNIKLNAFGITELAQGGTTKLTVNTDNITVDTNLFSNFGIDALNIFVNTKPVATQDYVQNYAVPAAGTESTTSPFEVSTAIKHTGYNYFQKNGNSFYISCESGPTIFGVTTESSAAASAANYYGKCTAANHIVNKAYLEGNTLPKTGNLTISGTAKFTNQTALNFEYAGDQSVLTKDDLLFYGLKADNSKPSWEACKVGIDPNNENFSAFTTGKRFYWSGTYVYLNGSVRNHLGNSTWDFRDNDTDNNIVLSINKTSVEYNGTIDSAKSIVTKEYIESVLPENFPSWAFRNSSTLGDNSTLDGLWSVQYVTTSIEGRVIIKAKNDTANIANGTIVTTLPANARPKSMAVIPLTSRDGLTTAFAVFSNQDGIITIQNVQGAGSNRLEGMLVYPIHDA